MTQVPQQGFPNISAPITGPNGRVSPPWYQLFIALWNRTGQAIGTISAMLDTLTNVRGSIIYRGADGWAGLGPGTAGRVLQTNGAGADPSWVGTGSGTVTSVGLTAPAEFSVAGSPVTAAGTLALTKANQTANQVWAGPTAGAAAAPAFRALVSADIPPASVTIGIAAAGSTQGDATALTTEWNEVLTAGAGQGVVFPAIATGHSIVVWNDGLNALKVYPVSGSQIDALGVNAAYSLPAGKSQIFRAISGTLLRSTQLG